MAVSNQRCGVCRETFSGTASGDRHRVLAGTYALWRNRRTGKVVRVLESGVVPGCVEQPAKDSTGDWTEASTGNVRNRCLTPDEMIATGKLFRRGPIWGGEPMGEEERARLRGLKLERRETVDTQTP